MTIKNISFTIFLPVRNGGDYLRLCIESILSQSYPYFDLIILENCSSDSSLDWLKVLVRQDNRVKLLPSNESLSIEANWSRILSIPKNEYMTMIGHDDLLDPNYLEVINQTINDNPNANLYLTHFRLIDSQGKLIRYCTPMPKLETVNEFIACRLAEIRDSFGTGYVIKSSEYEHVGGIPNYPQLLFSDDVLWIKLIDSGIKVTAPDVCFSYRLHAASTSGSPNHQSLFNALREYLAFLDEFSKDKKELLDVLSRYLAKFVYKRCQDYYNKLILTNNRKQLQNQDEVIKINITLNKYAHGYELDEQTILRGPIKKIMTIVSKKILSLKIKF